MLLFSTVLDIHEIMTRDDFVRLVTEWIQNSSHEENRIPDLHWNGEGNARFGNKNRWLEILESPDRNIIAVRFERTAADGAVWDTDYIMNFNEMKMAILLYRSYLEDAQEYNGDFSSPHFIRYLIDGDYIRPDSDFPITGKPRPINEQNLNQLVHLINGEQKYRLPVVYVSRTYCNQEPVDTGRLASRLKGVAHVLVQEDISSNRHLKASCAGGSPHHGAIGIWFPNDMIAPLRFLYHQNGEQPDEQLYRRVIESVIHYSNSQQHNELYTWQGVNNALLKDHLEKKRAESLAAEAAQQRAELEVEDVYAALDEEINGYQEQIRRLSNEIQALRAENQGLHRKLNRSDEVPLLLYGNEEELYHGEIHDITIEALRQALSHSPSRRSDVLRDVLEKNPPVGSLQEKRETIRQLLNSYDGMPSILRSRLKNLGFDITDDGKHYKLVFCGDGRYTTMLAKTPSDVREGKNAVSEIIQKML